MSADWAIGELRKFLPEWGYPPYVVAAICLELKSRAEQGPKPKRWWRR